MDFGSLVDVGFGGITEHVIEIGNNCSVAQLSKSISGGLEIAGETGVLVDQQQRRAFLRFFACEQDLSNEPPDAPLPERVVTGAEPYLVVGAMAGG